MTELANSAGLPGAIQALCDTLPTFSEQIRREYTNSLIEAEHEASVRSLTFKYRSLLMLERGGQQQVLEGRPLPEVSCHSVADPETPFRLSKEEPASSRTPPALLVDPDRPGAPPHVYVASYRTRLALGTQASDYNSLLYFQACVNSGAIEGFTVDVMGPVTSAYLDFVCGKPGKAERLLPGASVVWTVDVGQEEPCFWKVLVKKGLGRGVRFAVPAPSALPPLERRRASGLTHALRNKRPGLLDIPGITRPAGSPPSAFDHVRDLMTRWALPSEWTPPAPAWGEDPLARVLGLPADLDLAGAALHSIVRRLEKLGHPAQELLAKVYGVKGVKSIPRPRERHEVDRLAREYVCAVTPGVSAHMPAPDIAGEFWVHALTSEPELITSCVHFRALDQARRRGLLTTLEAIADGAARGTDGLCGISTATPEQVDLVIDHAHRFVEERVEAGIELRKWDRLLTPPDGRVRIREVIHSELTAIRDAEAARLACEHPDVGERRRREGWRGPSEGIGMSVEHVVFDVLKRVASGNVRCRYDRADKFSSLDAALSALANDPRKEWVVRRYRQGQPDGEPEHFARENQAQASLRGVEQSNQQALRELVATLDDEKHRASLTRRLQRIDDRHALATRGVKRRLDSLREEHRKTFVEVKKALDEKTRTRRQRLERLLVRVKSSERRLEDKHWRSIRDEVTRYVGGQRVERVLVQAEVLPVHQEIKLIYVVRSDGRIVVAEERVESGERPTHSELAGGLNVYGAGQMVLARTSGDSGWRLVEIDNGSGHYRPSADETLAYVKSRVAAFGIDISDARFADALLPGRPLLVFGEALT